jgi:hypothetical protein
VPGRPYMLGGGTSLQRALPPWAVLARHLQGVRTATSSAALMIWISAGIDCGSDLAAQAGHGLAVDLLRASRSPDRSNATTRHPAEASSPRGGLNGSEIRQGYHTGWPSRHLRVNSPWNIRPLFPLG